MKKVFLLLSFISLNLGIFAQIKLKLSTVSGDKGANVGVDFRVDNFTKIVSTNYTISYDTTKLQFLDIENFAPNYDLSTLSYLHLKGIIRFNWSEPQANGLTFPANTKLFNLKFKVLGNECDSTILKIIDERTPIEILDENQNVVPYELTFGKVKVNGPNCQGGGGGNDSTFTFVVDKIEVPKNQNGCVKVTAKNFKLINSFQGALKWDKSIARFTNITSNKLSNVTADINTTDSTFIRFTWDDLQGTGKTLPDNTVLFEACFDAVGAVNSITDMDIVSVPLLPIEVTGGGINSDVVPYKIEKGSYKVIGATTVVTFYTRDTSGTMGTELCVPVYVNNFKCMESFQFGIKFDKTKTSVTKVTSGGVTIAAGDIDIRNDSVIISWDSKGGPQVNLNDGAVLLNICFNLTGPCNMTVPIQFIDPLKGSPIDASGCNDPITVKTTNSNLTINCPSQPVTITILTTTQPSCPGSCDGAITVSVTGGSGNLTYKWLDGNNVPLSPMITTKDISGLCAGRYKLEVTDAGAVPPSTSRSVTVTLTDPPAMVITASIMNESTTGNDGKIDVDVTGGMPNYRYKWKRLPNTNQPADTTDIISGKRCGNYEVSVTDSKGCVAKDTFRIECAVFPLTCTTMLVDTLKCNGDCNGGVRVDVNGGVIRYRYQWSTGNSADTLLNLKNLCAGTYTVTVTDNLGTTCTSSITVTAPPAIKIVVTDSTCTNASAGSNKVDVTGGTPAYTYEWRNGSGNIVSTAEDLSNVAAGTYTLKVTDSKGCSGTYTATILVCNNPQPLNVTTTIDPKGQTGTTCNGSCDGKITATANGGSQPYKYKWSHNSNLSVNVADNLCAGTYTVTVTDANGATGTSSARITEPNALSISFRKINCASDNVLSDGSFEAVVSGGTRPYRYNWCSNETTSTASSLKAGPCELIVSDANGCTKKETLTVCSGTSPNDECFKGLLAISPNGDSYNDNFVISCVENYQNTLRIYTRWGKLVYTAIDYINQWNGVDADNEILNEGTYMWVLTVKEPGKNDVFYKGTVTIVR